jgi:uncharacterized Zn finger protein
MEYWGYPRYVPVAEKKAKAEKKLKKLIKDNPHIKPVLVEGRTLARTWWGKSWNLNLERYADYSNRIERGRSYVRNGAVLDLQIGSGKVDSLVQGTRSTPYNVTIKIKAITKPIWDKMKAASAGKLDSLQELLAGKFPQALGEIFMAKGEGLFPSPKEIEFNCSCPDWAYMCKHVAATLYGIGARLDKDPGLFFKLRQVEMGNLISQAVEDRTHKLLRVAEKKTGRVIDDSNLGDIFGIDMEVGAGTGAISATKEIKKKGIHKPEKKSPVGRKAGATVASPSVSKRGFTGETEAGQILKIVKRAKKGVDVSTVKRKTGIDEKKIRSTLYSALKRGDIERVGRGVYLGKR